MLDVSREVWRRALDACGHDDPSVVAPGDLNTAWRCSVHVAPTSNASLDTSRSGRGPGPRSPAGCAPSRASSTTPIGRPDRRLAGGACAPSPTGLRVPRHRPRPQQGGCPARRRRVSRRPGSRPPWGGSDAWLRRSVAFDDGERRAGAQALAGGQAVAREIGCEAIAVGLRQRPIDLDGVVADAELPGLEGLQRGPLR